MQVVTLLENESEQKNLKPAHGLSLYVETYKHKILFDVGPNSYFIKNAKQLGVNLEEIDILVISHGHFDHGSGLHKFLKINNKAVVYVSKYVFDDHVKQKSNGYENIGIKQPKQLDRFVFVDDDIYIDDEITIYAKVPFVETAIRDEKLKFYYNGRFIDENFAHEIYLVVQEEENTVLFSGCSHKGIENIIDTLESKHSISFTHIIGGYHFSHYDSFDFKQTDYLTKLGQKFEQRQGSKFYSCHCTGKDAYQQLKMIMRDKIEHIKTGDVIFI